jgi:membrane associated rhomboid family serine protease
MGWIFSIIGLWWVGAFVERVRGRRFFVRLFVGAGVAANVVAALVARLTSATGGEVRSDGAGFALTAVFVAFARIYGAQPAQIWGAFSMRADYFTWLLIGFSALVSLANRDWPGLAAELTAVAVALGATGGFSELARRGAAGKRARYRVLDGGKKRPTTLN